MLLVIMEFSSVSCHLQSLGSKYSQHLALEQSSSVKVGLLGCDTFMISCRQIPNIP
jgi:hypothetical protein